MTKPKRVEKFSDIMIALERKRQLIRKEHDKVLHEIKRLIPSPIDRNVLQQFIKHWKDQ